MSFLSDWAFWSFVVAAIALGVSVVPYIQQWLKRPLLEVEVLDDLVVTHTVGYPEAELLLQFRNAGGGQLRVREVVVSVESDHGAAAVLPVRSIYADTRDRSAMLFTPFTLDAGGEWCHVARFFAPLSREKDKSLRSLVHSLRKSIMKQRAVESLEKGNQEFAVAGEDSVVRKVMNLFNTEFLWKTGEYRLRLSVVTDREDCNATRNFRFTLFESDSEELHAYSEDYRWGLGVCFRSGEQQGLRLQLKAG